MKNLSADNLIKITTLLVKIKGKKKRINDASLQKTNLANFQIRMFLLAARGIQNVQKALNW